MAARPGGGAVADDHARYVASLTHYLLPHLGHVQLRQLHGDQLASLYRRLAVNGGRSGGPLAAKREWTLRTRGLGNDTIFNV